jgi:hypothetical protein
MVRIALALLVLGSLLIASRPLIAEEPRTYPGDAETRKIVEACWGISYQKRAGPMSGWRDGFLDTIECLEKVIINQIDVLFDHSGIWSTVYRDRLDHIKFAYARFHRDLAMENKTCMPTCGLIHANDDLNAHAQLLEIMLRNVIRKEFEYGFKPSMRSVPK